MRGGMHVCATRLEHPRARLSCDIPIDELGKIRGKPGGIMTGRAPAAHVERAAAVDEAQQSYTGLLRRCHSLRGKIGSREDEGHVGRDFRQDRKSTRLNSSHSQISYAVFCLK